MQDLGLKKGWLKEGDITEAEGDGSEDGSSDSGDVAQMEVQDLNEN
jgi:hypothetical protein